MKIPSLFGLCLILLLCVVVVSVGQKKVPAEPSLEETVTWMENFSAVHGFITLGGGLMRHNIVYPVHGCTVSAETSYPNAKEASQPKRVKATVVLSELAPNAVRLETDKDEGTYGVDFERSDSSPRIKEEIEMNDGTKREALAAQEELFFDSEESAKRFAHALTRAINLCGGKSAPF